MLNVFLYRFSVKLPCAESVLTQGVHLQLLPQPDFLQAVVEVGLWAAADDGGRQREDPHDLPLVPSPNATTGLCYWHCEITK